MRTIDTAFRAIPRKEFLPPELAGDAIFDRPIPIGFAQTNSQPTTVRQMLEWLDVKAGDKVLDVGSGSGWTTALLSYLTGQTGRVIAVERIAELVAFGTANCQRLKLTNITFNQAVDTFGWPEQAPYDRILVSASAPETPPELIAQLAAPGRMVIPVKNSIWVINRDKSGVLDNQEHIGFVFVPLL